MKYLQAGQMKLVAASAWAVENPPQLKIIFTLLTATIPFISFAIGTTHPGILVGPNGEGGSGGG